MYAVKEYMSDSFTNYNNVGNTKVSVSIKKYLNLESDQSEPVGHFFGKRHSPKKSVNFRDHSDSWLHHTLLSAITEIYGQSTIYSVHIVNTFLAYFAICFSIMLLFHYF